MYESGKVDRQISRRLKRNAPKSLLLPVWSSDNPADRATVNMPQLYEDKLDWDIIWRCECKQKNGDIWIGTNFVYKIAEINELGMMNNQYSTGGSMDSVLVWTLFLFYLLIDFYNWLILF